MYLLCIMEHGKVQWSNYYLALMREGSWGERAWTTRGSEVSQYVAF